VLRRLALSALLLAGFTLAASASPEQVTTLMPGVTFEKIVQFTPLGPVAIDVITGPKPGGLYTLVPALAHGSISGGLEPLAAIEQDASSTATVAGINGDSFSAKGYPTGIVLQNGVLAHGAFASRASIGIDSAGTLHAKRVSFVGTWKGAGQRRPLAGVNQIPRSGQVVLFTTAWGPVTPSVAGSTEVVLDPFPAATPNSDLSGPVTDEPTGGGTPIPADGAVLMSVGSTGGLPALQDDAPQGSKVSVRLILPTDWSTVTNAIGGGPVLVSGGKPVFHTGESFDAGDLAQHEARAGIGQLADGRILLVAVDGGQSGYSVGISVYDLARTLAGLGAVTAAALDAGSSVTAAFDGQLLSRPRTAGGRAVKDALLLEYAGVYAPPPTVPLLGKNNAAAGEQLSYKVVGPSNVTASVVSPSGQTFTIDSGSRQPGTYSFTWSTFDAEGTWHWNIQATDDQNQVSVADQPFQYDVTLSAVNVPRSASDRSGIVARFQLSRPAAVTLQVETPTGAIVRTMPPVQLPAGPGSVRWDGTLADGLTRVYPGSYVARVSAKSQVGTMELTAPFTLHS
jgi:hypothetical protein